MLHFFQQEISYLPLPRRFTYPFQYRPHPLCVMAAEQLQAYLSGQAQWATELAQGKMFGVLVVQTSADETGFLAAFSGNLAGTNVHPWFVPPVFDMLQPHDFFKEGERDISAINQRLKTLEADRDYLALKKRFSEEKERVQQTLEQTKTQLKADKVRRDEQREMTTDASVLAALQRESQHQKAEFKRLERSLKEELEQITSALKKYLDEIEQLKTARKTQSAALQQRLFDSFRLLNKAGEERGLCSIFADTVQKTPPAGAGECAAPKLLQYAFRNGMKPLAMAEFWWGASPKTEIRHHGQYYPACKGKCEPILGHMLQGMELDENPLLTENDSQELPTIVFEDEYLLVVNKPAGMLSVPGKTGQLSVAEYLATLSDAYRQLLPVHRLDMHTSGLLMLAKSERVHKQLQALFKNREVKKRYVALLDGEVAVDSGEITLPLSPDYYHRPRQKVDVELGKPAITHWEVLERTSKQTKVAFYPLTGRTHQLRVHAAHPDGLNCPIVGDPLYGKSGDRMYLHAESLAFVHPLTGEMLTFEEKSHF